jgi:hypothetical protein
MDPAPPPDADTEDQASDKQSAWSKLGSTAQRWIVIVGVIALVVGLIGGFAAGFKVEQNRVKTSGKKAASAAKKQKRITKVAGVVADTAAGSVNVIDTDDAHVKVLTPATVKVEKAVKGSRSDITPGSYILLRGKNVKGGGVEATEVAVLPQGSTLGTLRIQKVDGDKVTLSRPGNPAVAIKLTPTTVVYKTSSAKTSDIAKNSPIVVRGTGTLGAPTFTAGEILILAPGSAFAQAG